MSSSSKTTTLNLTQYSNTDIISFLDDYNVDMQKIDAFAASKNQNGGLASIDEEGKLYPMPTASDVEAAPISHASSATTYGVASTTQYGHVKYGTASGTACQGNDQRLTQIGTVQAWAGTSAPAGCLLCQGQAVSRTTYSALYSVIGTKYGSGDGSTTFNVPDMRSNIPVGYKSGDSDFGTVGKSGGNKTQNLYAMIGNPNGQTNQLGFEVGATVPTGHAFTRRFENLTVNGDVSAASNSTIVYGANGESATTIQPYITMNYIIKY